MRSAHHAECLSNARLAHLLLLQETLLMEWEESRSDRFHPFSHTSPPQMLGCFSLRMNRRRQGASAGPSPSADGLQTQRPREERAKHAVRQGKGTTQQGWDKTKSF